MPITAPLNCSVLSKRAKVAPKGRLSVLGRRDEAVEALGSFGKVNIYLAARNWVDLDMAVCGEVYAMRHA